LGLTASRLEMQPGWPIRSYLIVKKSGLITRIQQIPKQKIEGRASIGINRDQRVLMRPPLEKPALL